MYKNLSRHFDKTELQSYCDTSYSRGGVNRMWIMKNSKYLLEYIQSRSISSCTHRYSDCLLKNTSTKHNKYVVNKKFEHVDYISFRELFGSQCFFSYQNKICPFLAQTKRR
jgi:hypothetical protein